MDAFRNQGKSAKLTNNSRPARRSQKPSRVMLLTSTLEVLLPRLADFTLMLPHQSQRHRQRPHTHPIVLGQLDLRFKPELSFTSGTLHMDMKPRLLPREEVEPQPSSSEDGWTHAVSLTPADFFETSAQRARNEPRAHTVWRSRASASSRARRLHFVVGQPPPAVIWKPHRSEVAARNVTACPKPQRCGTRCPAWCTQSRRTCSSCHSWTRRFEACEPRGRFACSL